MSGRPVPVDVINEQPLAVSQIDSGLALALGHNPSVSVVNKSGRSTNVDTGALTPVAFGGIYRTPQVSGATQLRVKAGNINDSAAGSGARSVTLIGLDALGNEITETLATAGTSASAPTTASFIRLYRAFVASSGTYGSAIAPSHAAAITIENAAGTEDWAIINAADFPSGQTEIAAYSIPTGKAAYLNAYSITVESTKTANVVAFHRGSILDSSPPYGAIRALLYFTGLTDTIAQTLQTPVGPIMGPADIGFMANALSNNSAVACNFQLFLVDT